MEDRSNEIERLSANNPIVHACLGGWERGAFTYVEALERIVIALARVNDEQRQKLTAIIAEARSTERERCAAIVERYTHTGAGYPGPVERIARDIWHAIRTEG